MDIIVAGRRVRTEFEYREAAIGFVPTAQDFADFVEFVEDTSDPAPASVDAENIDYLYETVVLQQLQALEEEFADIVPLPRRGTVRITGREVRAA